MYGSYCKTKSIFTKDVGDAYTPITVKVKKLDNEWSCISEGEIIINLAGNSTDNDTLSLSSEDVDIVNPPKNYEPNVVVGTKIA